MSIPLLDRLPIRLKLALGYGLFLAGVMAAAGVLLLETMRSELMREADETLALRATHVVREISDAGQDRLETPFVVAALSDLLPYEEFSAPGVYVQVLDSKGVTVASSANLPSGQLPDERPDEIAAALAGTESYVTVQVGNVRMRELFRPVDTGDHIIGVVRVVESLRLLDVTLARMEHLYGVTAAVAALACLLGSWMLVGGALGPVAAVTQAAQSIGDTSQFDRRIAVPPARDELSRLVTTFNEMLARLDKTFGHHRQFLADVSHELRGPLAVIRANLDLLELDLPEQERRDSIRETRVEVERMSRLVSDLLFLAWVDAQRAVERRPTELHQVVLDVLNRATDLDSGSHRIELLRNDLTTVLADRDRIIQMLWNLVENALRYTPAGGQVTLSLRNHGHTAELEVADTGIGIAPEHLSRIFERFYRVDRTRPRHQGSTGLGLAIVKQVAEAHNGRVSVASKPGQGSTFTVALPVHQS